jgi:branched-subunit amino acid aminotransferase/4-amino-4-deoxychorismate lyase
MASPQFVEVQDWGVLYAYGLFETMRAYSGVLLQVEEHVDRMLASALALRFEKTPPREVILDRACKFARDLGDRVVRVTLTAGNPDTGLASGLILMERAISYTAAQHTNGISIRIDPCVRDERSPLVRHKTLNQLQNFLAWRDAQSLGYQESVFINMSGQICEGSRSNIFIVKAGQVLTPPRESGILPGITRRRVIALLQDHGIVVREAPITPDALCTCDECFVTSSVMEVMPVTRIGEQHLPRPLPGNITSVAATAYTRMAHAAAESCHSAAVLA